LTLELAVSAHVQWKYGENCPNYCHIEDDVRQEIEMPLPLTAAKEDYQ